MRVPLRLRNGRPAGRDVPARWSSTVWHSDFRLRLRSVARTGILQLPLAGQRRPQLP